MNAIEILTLKSELTQRLDTLRVTLNLSEDNLIPEIQELTTFRNASGLTQFIYYFFNKTRIRAAAEYEALYQLNLQPFDLQPEDLTLLNIFREGIPNQPFQISNEQLKGYEALKQTLYDGFASGKLSKAEQDKAIENFWDNLKYMLQSSESSSDRILAAYIERRNDCVTTSKPIILPSIRESARPPSFLLSLPDSGNARDYEDSLRAHGVQYGNTPIVMSNPLPSTQFIPIERQTRIFGLFTYTFMSDIQANIERTKNAFNRARESIHLAREHNINYMRPFIEGLQSLFNGWKTAKPPAQKTASQVQSAPISIPASEQSYTTKALTYVASFIPGIPGSSAAAPTQEKSWYSSYLP
jgi:hypothetical protein